MSGDDGADQGIGGAVENADGNGLPNESRLAIEYDDPIAMRSTGQLQRRARSAVGIGFFAGAFDENVERAAEKLLIVFFADLVLDRKQFVVASLFDVVRYVVGQVIGRFGSGPFAVLENKAVLEAAATK